MTNQRLNRIIFSHILQVYETFPHALRNTPRNRKDLAKKMSKNVQLRNYRIRKRLQAEKEPMEIGDEEEEEGREEGEGSHLLSVR